MQKITFSREETKAIVAKVQAFFRDELDQELGALPAERLLDFFAEEMGGFFYNRGLYDAQALLTARVESLTEAIYDLEQKTGFGR